MGAGEAELAVAPGVAHSAEHMAPHAARHLGVPTVAVFQTDIAGFAESYGVGFAAKTAWAWTRPSSSRA